MRFFAVPAPVFCIAYKTTVVLIEMVYKSEYCDSGTELYAYDPIQPAIQLIIPELL
jgi:hypothetical protein